VAEDWWAEHLAALTGCTIRYGAPLEGNAVSRVIAGPVQAFIPLEGLVDVEAERDRLKKALDVGEADLERSRSKLANPNFRDRAPADVVANEEAKVAAGEERSAKLLAQLEELR
jgi:valyl-tRNA synthetase